MRKLKNFISESNIDHILSFLPFFEELFSLRPEDQEKQLASSDKIPTFLQVLYDEGFMYRFDPSSWIDQANKFLENPDKIDEAELDDLRKLVTTYGDKNHFDSGILAGLIKTGLIVRILQRVKVLREQSNG